MLLFIQPKTRLRLRARVEAHCSCPLCQNCYVLSPVGLHFSVSGDPILTVWNFSEKFPGPALVGVRMGRVPTQCADGGAILKSPTDGAQAYREGAHSQMVLASTHFGRGCRES